MGRYPTAVLPGRRSLCCQQSAEETRPRESLLGDAMVMQTVLDRFRQGRRLNNLELPELLEETPELHGQVVEHLRKRHLTRRAFRQMIERVPELRVELGQRLLAREPRILDLLEVIEDARRARCPPAVV
jgi:hypothetical protein